jgi:cytochrome b pre-mRNA-processing protein 3
MIFHLFRRALRNETMARLYGTIVAQARAPAFYQIYGVPDTVNGRFELIVLHAVLLLHRLQAEPSPVCALGQGVFDQFCRDMDANLRVMGVGDLAVPRSMRRVGEAFYGRRTAYEAALGAPDQAPLAVALARNVFGLAAGPMHGADRLAGYVREAVGHLAAQDSEALSRAELTFPDPIEVAVPDPTAAGNGNG